MKRNVFIKGILISLVIVLFTLALVGCVPTAPPPTTGTVYIVVTGTWYYDLYMDYTEKFSGVSPGTYVLYNVPIGNHYFQAIDIDGSSWGYFALTKYIGVGTNYVYLYPSGGSIL